MTTAEVVRRRKAFLRSLSPLFRAMGTANEALERELSRILNRRRAFPEETDMVHLLELIDKVLKAYDIAVTNLAGGYPV